MRVAGVGEEADQRLVQLHALRLLGAVGRDRALRALRRDRTGAIREQQAHQRLEREQVVFARRVPEQRGESDLAQAQALEHLLLRDAAEAPGLVLLRIGRSADQRAEQL